jgi:hypothetical protein
MLPRERRLFLSTSLLPTGRHGEDSSKGDGDNDDQNALCKEKVCIPRLLAATQH